MDASGTDRALLVGFSCGVAWSLHVAADQPDRVTGIVAIGTSCGLYDLPPELRFSVRGERGDPVRGWARYNEHYWREDVEREATDWYRFQQAVRDHQAPGMQEIAPIYEQMNINLWRV